jgi:hypothetical protein
MKKGFSPDFGLCLLKQKGKNTKFTFLPIKIYSIARVGDKLYSTTVNMHFGDTVYAVTLDFSEDMYFELLKLIPDNITKSLKQIFEWKFENPQMVDLPYPISLGIEARLSEVITSEEEQYMPFEVIEVFKTE